MKSIAVIPRGMLHKLTISSNWGGRNLRRWFSIGVFGTLALMGATSAPAGDYRTISIDGQFTDWAGIEPAYDDAVDEGDWTDLKTIYLANDDEYVYLRLELHTAADPFTARNNYYFNTDNDQGTGLVAGVGSEMLVQSGAGYQERDGGFNEGGVNGLDWMAAPTGAATSFEFRVSRAATYASDGANIFGGDVIGVMFEAQNAAFARRDVAPDSGSVEYILAVKPPPLTTNTTLLDATTSVWRVNATNTAPPPEWMSLTFNDGIVGWTNGMGFFGSGAAGGPIQTNISADRSAFYLRHQFSWANDPGGVILVATGYPSDGAVYYMNGVEIRRTAMPSGPITHSTPALGTGPLQELFSIPANTLRQGSNVLAVEAHQAIQANTDFSFGFSLLAAISYPPTIPDASEPQDQSVREGEGASITVPVLVTEPATYQWFKDGSPLIGENQPSLVIPEVRLTTHAGLYALEVRNDASPTAARSRDARLTVIQEPVTIADQPDDVELTAGQPFSLSVTAGGTGPFTYQWFHGDGSPVPEATLATYGGVATALDDGEYYVVISNPIPSSATSRRARVTVQTDTEKPRLASVTGANRKVIVVFSEPVSADTANDPSRYTLTPTVPVLTATRDPGAQNTVVLTTGPHDHLKEYRLNVTGMSDLFGNSIVPGSSASFRSSILMDGSFDDWETIEPVIVDAAEEPVGGLDLAEVQITNDEGWLYLRLTLHAPGVFNSSMNNIFIDANPENPGLSVVGVGSEMLIQQSAGYQEKNGGFNEGPILDLNGLVLPEGSASSFEMRFSLQARYEDGELVFVAPALRLAFDAENASFQTVDVAPDAGGADYSLHVFTVGPLSIRQSSASEITLEWTGPGVLHFSPTIGSGSWQPIPDAVSPFVQPIAPDPQKYFRLSLP